MQSELPKQYIPSDYERSIYQQWLQDKAFAATPRSGAQPYVIMMPLPNVTGALHMGHAMDNVMQDLLIRWHRMQGHIALWQPGTDHAGIATQAIVEKRLFELEGKTRHDLGREGLVQRIWDWKQQYQARIIRQQQVMGCSCDWDRQRFTMDPVCARAVFHAFFMMFQDGLIYRGFRLVNWDCHLQTAVADDEIVHETVQGHFWHLRYPVIDPQPGEPDHVIVATTRPETMLGDTAVACHPEPEQALNALIEVTRQKLAEARDKTRGELQTELDRLQERRQSLLPRLQQLVQMARAGRQVRLPLLDRPIPLICDPWAKPELGSGCVKITPAHDPNDYEVWTRHRDSISIINILAPDGSLNDQAGPYAHLDRFEARQRVVAHLDAQGLLEHVEEREVEIGHSDRSKTPIEPYLSKQWFVRMGDVDGGIVCGRGTAKAFKAPGLAQAALNAACPDWKSPSGRNLRFHPDADRYASTYLNWLAEKRDWCISRQLWWGHRIPIWWARFEGPALSRALENLRPLLSRDEVAARLSADDGTSILLDSQAPPEAAHLPDGPLELQVALRTPDHSSDLAHTLEAAGLTRDPDVLDTWFSSGLWPLSTLGWPHPESALLDPGQTALGGSPQNPDSFSFFYPGSCLVTGRDIITLWVVRMQMMGLYCAGDVPFTDCFIHANILDGKGERMSKSKGNGIDPADIIEQYGADAMRYVLCDMQTGMQDIRLPVQAISPFTGELVDLATTKHGRSIFTYLCPKSGQEFDVLGTMEGVPAAKLVSDRFEVGRNFCNKLWNATRFALLNLEGAAFQPRALPSLLPQDRWILSRLTATIREVSSQLAAYNPSAALSTARDFFWGEFCDWYVELSKPALRDPQAAPATRQVLAAVLDQCLRLLHPFVPFITEALWAKLREIAPTRGIHQPLPDQDRLLNAAWPQAEPSWHDPSLEQQFTLMQEVARRIREIRSHYTIPHSQPVPVSIKTAGPAAETLRHLAPLLQHAALVDDLQIAPDLLRTQDAAARIFGDTEIYVRGVIDPAKERAKLEKQKQQLLQKLEVSRKKLGNENFIQRAKPEVVERERAMLAEFEGELRSIEANLQALNPTPS